MRVVFSLAAAFFISAITAAASGTVDLSIQNGRITLDAREATLYDILEAWSRTGGTSVVNAEKIGGPPLSIRLVDVPEEQALDTLLRSVSGYLAVPRIAGASGQSRFDRIVILPSSSASRGAVEPPAPPPIDDRPAVAPTNVNGVARILGPDGQPVEDDQAETQPRPPAAAQPRR